MPELQPVESSMFSHMGYDPAAQALTVRFTASDFTHTYTEVPPEVYATSKGAESLGKWFNATIKGKFNTTGPQPIEGADGEGSDL